MKESRISLDNQLVRNKHTTFSTRVDADWRAEAGLENGDLLVINSSLNTENGKIGVSLLDGDFTVRRNKKEK